MFAFRYVVRAKSGKRQSAQDATGKAANSAGSSLRRYNEAALKKVHFIGILRESLYFHLNFVFLRYFCFI